MALTIAEIIKTINPNIGVIINLDGVSYRIGVEDVNSAEILTALQILDDWDDGANRANVNILRSVMANITATIASAAALSNEIDLAGSALQTILMPAAWTAAVLTFQIAEATGGTFQDVYDDSGSEVTVTVAASRAIPMPAEIAGARFVKIRSGTTGTPVNQGAERLIVVLLKG